MKIDAIIWDFDGTLVDSVQKNLNVTRKIIKEITGKSSGDLPVLRSIENYESAIRDVQNWRELYLNYYGLSPAQTDLAGSLWTDFQLNDQTPTPLFKDVKETLHTLDGMPQAIFSQNSKATIKVVLEDNNVSHCFKTIVGYEEVGFDKQKPAPEGLFVCIDDLLGNKHGTVLFVGDHPVDIACAVRANEQLLKNSRPVKVVSVGAFFGNRVASQDWDIQPQVKASHPFDIVNFVKCTH